MGKFKNSNVVMLPTNEKARVNSIVTRPSDNRMAIVNVLTVNDPQPSIHQHLYILSDEIITVGDWYYDSILNEIDQCILHIGKHASCKKIIATTDCLSNTKKLKYVQFDINVEETRLTFVPQPSKAFIEKYVDSYNKNIVIENVQVEYEMKNIMDDTGFFNYTERLKVNPKDNTITIKKTKDTFTRKEVIDFAIKFADHCLKEAGLNNMKSIGEMFKFEKNI
jgi:hypothetical protein